MNGQALYFKSTYNAKQLIIVTIWYLMKRENTQKNLKPFAANYKPKTIKAMNTTINNQPKFETGATSHAVNDLILFTDNTRELADLRDYLYQSAINNEAPKSDIWTYFGGLKITAVNLYKKEFGRANSLHVIQMSGDEIKDYCTLYANDFENWKKEHGY